LVALEIRQGGAVALFIEKIDEEQRLVKVSERPAAILRLSGNYLKTNSKIPPSKRHGKPFVGGWMLP
jgi:hypothetical protein